MQVTDLMTRDPIVVPPEMTVTALVQLLADRHVTGVFVVDSSGHPVGVVTEADVIERLAPSKEETDLGWVSRMLTNPERAAERYVRLHGTHVRDVMTSNVIGIDEEASVAEATRKMREARIRRLAVLRGDKLVGVVSRADLLKAVAQTSDALGIETDDARIQRAIVQEMRRHTWADVDLTAVLVRDGVVTLEGYCRTAPGRDALRVLAERAPGVRKVVDRLELTPLYPAVPPM